MSNLRCERISVRGDVQGVCFRYHTKREADRLGLSGWVKNRPDGSVEAIICGTGEKISIMRIWLSHGPPAARVSDIQIELCREIFSSRTSFQIICE